MPDFVGEVCWKPEVVLATVATEAVHPSASVFLATHSPLRIQRRKSADLNAESGLVTETEVLDEFLNSPTDHGVLVAPVIGESGSGKSHLVRWAAANIEETERRRVIYLPKAETNLASVVRALLRGHQGTLSEDLLRVLDRLGNDTSAETLQRRILDELAEAILTTEPRNQHEKFLVGHNRLSALMHDPYLRDHLLTDGSLVPRKAAHAINGRGRDEDDIPLEFTVEDLPLTLTGVHDNASRDTAKVFRALVAQPHMQIAAVSLLNRCIDVAVMKATSLGVGRVQQAFLEIREQLAGKQEIVLLIEDFALIQGVQRDLLDAIVESSATVQGKQRAPIRTLMAVTGGFYRELPATFRTRAEASSPVYELDLAMTGSDAVPDAQITDFVGRYLNAARLGQARIDTANVAAGGEVPNACDRCQFQDPCHSAFGVSQQGYGLYPYNSSALLRAVRSSAPADRPGDFNPRSVLARVIRQGLTEAARPLSDGEYPDQGFAALFPPRPGMPRLGLSAQETLSEFAPAQAQRRQLLLEFWGGAPGDLFNLTPGIHRAFDIPELPKALISDGSVPAMHSTPRDHPPPPGDQHVDPPALRESLATVTRWANGEVRLPQTLANDIRRIVRDAVVNRIEWSDPVTKERASRELGKAFPANAKTVWIEDAAGQNLTLGAPPEIEFKRNAGTALHFQEWLRAKSGATGRTVRGRARLDAIARAHAPRALAELITWQQFDDEHLLATVHMLLIGAAACGHIGELAKANQRVSAVLWDGGGPTRCDSAWRVQRWTELESEHRAARVATVKSLTEAIGTSQGVTGAVHAIDPARLTQLVDAAWRRDPNELRTDQLPAWARPAWTPLARLMTLTREQEDHLREHVAQVRALVPMGVGFQETVAASNAAAKAGENRGLVPAAPAVVAAANTEAASYEFQTITALETALGHLIPPPSNPWVSLITVGRDYGSDPAAIGKYLTETNKWVTAGLERAATQKPVAMTDLDDDIANTLQLWEQLVQEAP